MFPAKPTKITLDTLPALFAHNRARFGGWSMTATGAQPDPSAPGTPAPPGAPSPVPVQPQPPERPDIVTEEEWAALGDPGRRAITRERERADAAERALAASRARPAPPRQDPPKQDPPKQDPNPKTGDQSDLAAIVQQAVQAAVKPFIDAQQQAQAQTAAERVQTAVLDAAKDRFHDATDALANIDLTGVVDDQGRADPAKIKTALDDLVTRKPHLAKTPGARLAPPGIGGGAPAGVTEGEKVKAVLADMQRATGVRLPHSPASNTH